MTKQQLLRALENVESDTEIKVDVLSEKSKMYVQHEIRTVYYGKNEISLILENA